MCVFSSERGVEIIVLLQPCLHLCRAQIKYSNLLTTAAFDVRPICFGIDFQTVSNNVFDVVVMSFVDTLGY